MWKYFFFTGLIFVLSGAIFSITLTNIDPLGTQKNVGFFLFYISCFLGISTFFTLLLFFAKEIWFKKRLGHKSFAIALRRGILIGFLCTAVFFLQMFRMFDIYEALLLLIFLSLIEYLFLTNKPIKK